MAFTAPTYSYQTDWLPDWFPGNEKKPDAPGKTPEEAAAADAALLAKLNRPPGSKIISHAPDVDKDGKPTGGTVISIVDADGLPNQIIVDAAGNMPAGGTPLHAPDKAPTPPAPGKTQAQIDQAAADAHAAAIAPKAGTGPRIDSPAETQSAATSAAAQAETARHNAAGESQSARSDALQAAAQAATNVLGQAKLAWDQRSKQLDQDLANHKLSFDEWQSQWQAAHAQAQDAQSAADGATAKWRDEQTAQYQQGSLANANAQTAESGRHNTATEAEATRSNQATEQQNAATLLQRQQADQQASLDRNAVTGAALLRDRGTMAQGVNDSLMGQATGAKNIGLGSQADVSSLPAAAQGWATQMMGGQSTMDQAAKMVHDANPALSRTPEGAQYTALMHQVLDKQASLQTPGMTGPDWQRADQPNTPPQADGNAAPGMTGTVNPGDPRYLGSVIGAAVAHVSSNGQGQFTAPGVGSFV